MLLLVMATLKFNIHYHNDPESKLNAWLYSD